MRPVHLSASQLKTLVNIIVELGVIGIAAIALPVFFDKGSRLVLASGILFSIGAWSYAVWLSKKI